ncbi:hypothetical protein GCM10028775_23550 [Catellatospora paridis]
MASPPVAVAAAVDSRPVSSSRLVVMVVLPGSGAVSAARPGGCRMRAQAWSGPAPSVPVLLVCVVLCCFLLFGSL